MFQINVTYPLEAGAILTGLLQIFFDTDYPVLHRLFDQCLFMKISFVDTHFPEISNFDINFAISEYLHQGDMKRWYF